MPLYPNLKSRIGLISIRVLRASLIGAFALLSGGFLKADLLVSYYYLDQVSRFSSTGSSTGPYVTPASGGLDGPLDMALGPDGRLYVAAEHSNGGPGSGPTGVYRYDANTGAFVDIFASGLVPRGLAFAANGDLLASQVRGGQPCCVTQVGDIRRLQAITGADMGAFASGIAGPHDLLFTVGGDLLVSAFFGGQILKYSSAGVSEGVFATVKHPRGMEFGPDNNFYVTSDDLGVVRFDASGNLVGIFVPLGSGGLLDPNDLSFGPDGNLYVASTNGVLRYNGSTGAFMDDFVPGSGVDRPFNLLFLPSTTAAVPEPASFMLLGSVCFVAAYMRKRRAL